MSDAKRRSQLETTRAVWRRLRPFRGRIVFSTTLATASALTTLYIPRLIGRAVDLIVGPNQVDFHGIGRIAIGIVLCALAVAVCQQLMALTNNSVAFAASRKLREEAFAKLQTLPLKYIDSQPYGDVVGRLASDVEQFADGLLLALTQFFSGVASIVGVLVFMFATNVWIALVVVALTPISLVVAGAIARRSFNLFGRRSILQGRQTAFASETSSCRRVAIAFGREERLADAYDELDEELSRASFGATFVSSLANPATRFVNGLVYMTVGVVGAFAVARGALSVGQLVVFLSYSEQYAKPFNEISGVATEVQNALACAGRIFEFLEAESEEPDPSDALAPESARGEVEFEEVDFSYDPSRPLIERFSLSVPPGSRVAIVGPTGCGKTTLVNLLMRFYEPVSGRIRVDGTDARKIERSALRALFGMVLQETWLKSGTIRENVLMGATDVDDEEFARIATACRLESFVKRLPNGYDTMVSPDGGEFSQGQRQLICVARVMARRPDMLILDEATSSIDVAAERKIQRAFAELTPGKTSFIVAHRLSTIRDADVILAMDDGKIVERGTHEELIAKRGFYWRLYSSQFQE